VSFSVIKVLAEEQCDLCNRTLKDSLSYLDHVNGRLRKFSSLPIYNLSNQIALTLTLTDLRRLGQTTQVERSTLSQVRAKIAALRAATADKVTARNFDFQKRLQAVKDADADEKARRKEERKRKREERREDEQLARMGIIDAGKRAKGAIAEPDIGADGVRDRGADRRGKGRQKEREKERERREQEHQQHQVDMAVKEHEQMSAMLGFGGFGGVRKR
jgi:U4/U6.U5 tri-snRNP component SNU23